MTKYKLPYVRPARATILWSIEKPAVKELEVGLPSDPPTDDPTLWKIKSHRCYKLGKYPMVEYQEGSRIHWYGVGDENLTEYFATEAEAKARLAEAVNARIKTMRAMLR